MSRCACFVSCRTGRRRLASGGSALVCVLLAAVSLSAAISAAGQAPAEGVTFAVFGDNRGGKDGAQPAVFSRIIQQLTQTQVPFVLGTGDYIYGSNSQDVLRNQWNEFFVAMAPLQGNGTKYVALAPGNHEIWGGGGRKLFEEYFGPTYRSFNWGGSHFIVLDTEVAGQESRIAGEQLEWLRQDLAGAEDAWHIFVAIHRPFWPVASHKGDSLDMYPQERDALHQLFVQHRVSCVFQGHEHLYDRQTHDGVEYIITGGGGAALYATPDNGGFHHFLSVTADRLRYKVDIVRVK